MAYFNVEMVEDLARLPLPDVGWLPRTYGGSMAVGDTTRLAAYGIRLPAWCRRIVVSGTVQTTEEFENYNQQLHFLVTPLQSLPTPPGEPTLVSGVNVLPGILQGAWMQPIDVEVCPGVDITVGLSSIPTDGDNDVQWSICVVMYP